MDGGEDSGEHGFGLAIGGGDSGELSDREERDGSSSCKDLGGSGRGFGCGYEGRGGRATNSSVNGFGGAGCVGSRSADTFQKYFSL